MEAFREKVRDGEITSWEDVHDFYRVCGENYAHSKLIHALGTYAECLGIALDAMDTSWLEALLWQAEKTKAWMVEGIYTSREKDYSNPFRSMVYDSDKEMDTVLGRLEDNGFIAQERKNLDSFSVQVASLIKRLK
jgi:hypothetical protein